MKTETDLQTILRNLSPKINNGEYVFCTVPHEVKLTEVEVIATFLEEEGKTLVIRKEFADPLNLSYEAVMSWITLNIYSSHEAVGLTAVISAALAKNNICCNVIAAYYHDHIFVPMKDADRTIALLNELVKPASSNPSFEI